MSTRNAGFFLSYHQCLHEIETDDRTIAVITRTKKMNPGKKFVYSKTCDRSIDARDSWRVLLNPLNVIQSPLLSVRAGTSSAKSFGSDLFERVGFAAQQT